MEENFDNWFNSLSEKEQKEFFEEMEADTQIMIDKDNF